MIRSCKYCGRIHDTNINCGKRPKRIKTRSEADRFRSTKAWQNKRDEIKIDRDKCLCQICIRKLHKTVNQYTFNNLSVHHNTPLEEDFDKRLDNDNLLTTCDYHHEMAESGEIPRDEIQSIIDDQEAKYNT